MTSVPDMGGDIFTLAGEISGSDGFMAQARFIAGVYGGTIPEYAGQKREKESVRTEKHKESSRFEEVVCGPLRCNALLGYLKGRGIPEEIARAECEEIRFRLYGKRYFAVAFGNESGGYEIRNPFFKGSYPPKNITRISAGNPRCNVFEGFIDFLSAERLGYNDGNDSVVLNSVANVGKAIPALAEYPLILCYLDNDTAGRAAVARLRREFGDRVSDKSALYPDHKDLNDYLQSLTPKKTSKLKL